MPPARCSIFPEVAHSFVVGSEEFFRLAWVGRNLRSGEPRACSSLTRVLAKTPRMETLLPLALVLLTFLWWARRQGELFVVSVRRGKLLTVRGRVPQGLLSDYRPLLRHVKRGTILVRKSGSSGALSTHGIDANTAQRLRNLLGIRPYAQLLGAAPIRNPSIGQRLGIGWLAWWCARDETDVDRARVRR